MMSELRLFYSVNMFEIHIRVCAFWVSPDDHAHICSVRQDLSATTILFDPTSVV